MRARRSRSPLDGSAELISVKQLTLCVCVWQGGVGGVWGGGMQGLPSHNGRVRVGGWVSLSF